MPAEILTALNSAVLAPTIRLDKPDTALRVMHCRWKDADVYLFFFNESPVASDRSVALLCPGSKVQAWDPQTASIAAMKSSLSRGHPTIRLSVQPYQARLVVVR